MYVKNNEIMVRPSHEVDRYYLAKWGVPTTYALQLVGGAFYWLRGACSMINKHATNIFTRYIFRLFTDDYEHTYIKYVMPFVQNILLRPPAQTLLHFPQSPKPERLREYKWKVSHLFLFFHFALLVLCYTRPLPLSRCILSHQRYPTVHHML